MDAMSKMLANMIGLTPDQMTATVKGFGDTIVRLDATLTRIEAKQDIILQALIGDPHARQIADNRSNEDG